MSSNDIPSAPDYSPIINAQTANASNAGALSAEQQQWAKDQFTKNTGTTDKTVAGQQGIQTSTQAASDADRKRYQDVYQPVEDQYLKTAQGWASPERKDQQMGAAQATVGQNFEAARQSATRDLESFGLNPSDTRYAALDVGTRAQEAAAKAGAANTASTNLDVQQQQMLAAAVPWGQQTAANSNTSANTSVNAGTAGTNAALANTATGANTLGTGGTWSTQQQGALQGAAGTTGTQFSNQLDSAKAKQTASSGIGSLIGGLAGLAIPGGGTIGGAIGSKVGGMLFSAEGGAVDQPTQGGAIPTNASPTGGRGVDDVSAQLTAGEFVVPRDVTKWKGEEFFQKLIEQSRKAKDGATAKPTVKQGAIPADPSFQSRPMPASQGQQSALPV